MRGEGIGFPPIMSSIQSKAVNAYKSSGAKSDKQTITSRLNQAGICTQDIAIPLQEGTKKCNIDFTQASQRVDLSDAPANYAIYPKGDLAFIDIDDRQKTPDKLLEETKNTFTDSSPHGTHRWVLIDGDAPNIKREWGEIRTENQYVVAPGSTLLNCKNGCCSDSNPGIYGIKQDAPIQEYQAEQIADYIGGFDTGENVSDNISIPDIDEEKIAKAQNILKDLQLESIGFFNDLMDRLKGGRGKMGEMLNKEDSPAIDRSKADFVTLQHLYGVFRHYGEEEMESRKLAYQIYTHYSRENQYHTNGTPRKWLNRDTRYRQDMLKYAVNKLDQEKFSRLFNQNEDNRMERNEYSEITYGYVSFVIDYLIENYDKQTAIDLASIYGIQISPEDVDKMEGFLSSIEHPCITIPPVDSGIGGSISEYPSPKLVREICTKIDRNTEDTYEKVLKKLRKQGQIKLACIKEGVDYRVYPPDREDPQDAEWIRYQGEKIEP